MNPARFRLLSAAPTNHDPDRDLFEPRGPPPSKKTGSNGAWQFRVYYPNAVGPVWSWQVVLAAAGDFEKSFSNQLTTRRVYGRTAAADLR